ncbi:MAG: tetratricopeptide repeat protein [Romboutsia sp.]
MKNLDNGIYEYNKKDAENQLELAITCISEKNREANLKEFIILCKKSALQGNSTAQYILGVLYQSGIEGIEEYLDLKIPNNIVFETYDMKKSIYWFEKSSKQGDSNSQNNLGYIYEKGLGVDIDYKKAMYFYKKSASQGDEIGQCNLGYMYEKGLGVEIDYKKAIFFYEKSASQGDEVGQNNLGEMYRDAIGVEADYKKALYWFELSASQGCTEAQYNIGYMYEHGLGVSVDYEKAKTWYQQAADEYHEKSNHRLKALSD